MHRFLPTPSSVCPRNVLQAPTPNPPSPPSPPLSTPYPSLLLFTNSRKHFYLLFFYIYSTSIILEFFFMFALNTASAYPPALFVEFVATPPPPHPHTHTHTLGWMLVLRYALLLLAQLSLAEAVTIKLRWITKSSCSWPLLIIFMKELRPGDDVDNEMGTDLGLLTLRSWGQVTM